MDWNSTSANARDVMLELGFFEPTINVSDCEVKGWTSDGHNGLIKTYWDSDCLRRIAQGCTEVADWLDARAANTHPKD
jgi:hypothetical protein